VPVCRETWERVIVSVSVCVSVCVCGWVGGRVCVCARALLCLCV